MSKLSDIVETLEEKLALLLDQHRQLKLKIAQMEEEKEHWMKKEEAYEEEIVQLQNKNETLKHANSILGSNQYNRETKRKVNALIREIDNCIMQLSE